MLGRVLVMLCGMASVASWADPLAAVQLLRVSGCAGVLPAFDPLQNDRNLDRAAARWAAGEAPLTAAGRSGYRASSVVALHLSGPDDSILQALRRTRCRVLADRALRDIGVYSRGRETWLLLAARGATEVPPTAPSSARANPPSTSADEDMAAQTYGYATAPVPARGSSVDSRVLLLVNGVRARGTRCGEKSFGPAPALQLSKTLDSIAAEHAEDMARHDYFEHVDLGGHTPADRVRASGYREKLVGENIAYGPSSADEVVAGWLHSTGHCENIMDPRFTEMGLAQASGRGERRGLYWDQVLAQPVP
jgi:uncharacterized protein YkwD